MPDPKLDETTRVKRVYRKVFRKRPFFTLVQIRLLAFLAVLGPGFITANVDNDPGGIFVYSQAGAKFGYALLWTLIPTTIALMVVQEMAARMGVVTGKGLSDLIREEFGIRAAVFTMLVLGVANFANIVAEFAGLAAGMGIFDVSKYLVVPAGAALVWAVVVKGSYKPIERMLILFSLIYFTYPISAFYARPNWGEALHSTFVPVFSRSTEYLVMVVGLVGTTITPWMQFYLQASIVEKEIPKDKYNLCRWDVFLGCIMTDVIAFFIVVACAATIYAHGHRDITDASQAAMALEPLAGKSAKILFSVGLVNASLLSAAILPLATAYNICEGLGVESGVNKKFSEAPVFYWLYTLLIVGGAGFVLIPKLPLIKVMIISQVANGILLPFVLVYMLLLVNRRELMGEYKNSALANIIAWSTCIIMILLTGALIWTTVRP
jgi:NRAMP (natural resistance-associated macrophage protein)-like metal ion transporter